LKKHLKGEIFP